MNPCENLVCLKPSTLVLCDSGVKNIIVEKIGHNIKNLQILASLTGNVGQLFSKILSRTVLRWMQTEPWFVWNLNLVVVGFWASLHGKNIIGEKIGDDRDNPQTLAYGRSVFSYLETF